MIERLRAVGDQGIVVDCVDLRSAQQVFRALDASRSITVRDLVPGARSVLVRVSAGDDLSALARWVREATAGLDTLGPPQTDRCEPPLTLHTRYDGPDLADVARRCGCTVAAVIATHVRQIWTVAFVGFSPGFAYLTSDDPQAVHLDVPRVDIPRLDHPRHRVEAGAVGLAGQFTGCYPRASPAGWRIIGHTDAPLWDVHRDPPALLRPGLRVRFEQVP